MIHTFYSFKGGVGRSMALANVAEYLRRKGLKVIIVDWDLEAPGLENYFFSQDQIEKIRAGTGLLDLLLLYRREFAQLAYLRKPVPSSLPGGEGNEAEKATESVPETEPRPSWPELFTEHLPPLSTFLHRVPRMAGNGTSSPTEEEGELLLLTSGWRDGERFAGYARDVQDFDWAELYNACEGAEFFAWMGAELRARADIVLIDSRTGVTEMGGICTRNLADVVIAFCTPNFKTVETMLRVIKSFQPEKRPELKRLRQDRPVKLIVVPTRLDLSELRFNDEFQNEFRPAAQGFRPQEFVEQNVDYWSLGVPYVPFYTYQEALALGGPGGQLEQVYKKLAAHMALLSPAGGHVRFCMRDDLRQEFRELPRIVISWAGSDGQIAVAGLRADLEKGGLRSWEEPTAGENWLRERFALIEQSEFLIVLLTPRAFPSKVMYQECAYARSKGLRIIPVIPSQFSAISALLDVPLWITNLQPVRLPEEWERLVSLLQQETRPKLKVPLMAPPVPEHWVAREQEQNDLAAALLSEAEASKRPVRVVLSGPGGSGKSCLASVVCREPAILDYFSGGILWADLQPRAPQQPQAGTKTVGENVVRVLPAPATLEELTRIHVALTGERPAIDDIKLVAESVAEKIANARCLLVLDNVADTAALTPFLEAGRSCSILLLTRQPELDLGGTTLRLNLGAVTDEQGLAILAKSLPADAAPTDTLRELRRLIEPQPGALRVAAEQYRERLLRETPAAALSGVLQTQTSIGVEHALTQITEQERETLSELAKSDEENHSLDLLDPSLVLRLAGLRLLELMPEKKLFRLERGLRLYLRHLEGSRAAAAANAEAKPKATPAAVLVEKARLILRSTGGAPQELLSLAGELKRVNEFGYARKLLSRARKDPRVNEDEKLRRKLIQQQALCTYKDPDEPLADRLDRALEILAEGESLSQTIDQETLGIVGAIHKRKWEADGQRQHLERSLGFYLRGYRQGLAKDYGYTGINAAYILDCLAAQEEAAAESASTQLRGAQVRSEEASNIRKEIMLVLPQLLHQSSNAWLGQQWWFAVTIAEAAFGLGDYDEASIWLARAKQMPVEDWEFESTARQLAALARMQAGPEDTLTSPAWDVIQRFLGNEAAAESKFVGKVGLALSGGGFRASLFHIGVLARLAELDLLRSVEVLSCVSGGSIIGAHYYLELRRLLQTKADHEITQEDYLAIVRSVERDFLDGIQRNIRVRVAAEWTTNVRMIFDSDYSRTHRAGELFEEEIFARIGNGDNKAPLYLNELKIQPKGESEEFKPKYQNWRRRAKVPVLILNATALNTGHNWQFTTSFMGESPNAIDTKIDGNDRLRRMYYSDAPDGFKRMRLGHAVAASACVPGLFEPLEMAGLFPEMTVCLVDGGVHDNQGIAGLLEQDASFLVISDASGQMALQKEPSKGLLGVPLRANSILMARVREAEFHDVRARRRSGLLRELIFVHLKRDLEVDAIDWNNCPDPYDASESARPAERRGLLTGYGIRKDMQEKLAALRTDLDSFSDAEAFALMTSGYRMIEHEFAQRGASLERKTAPAQSWRFLQMQRFLDLSKGYEEGERTLLERLRVGSQLAFKAWRLSRPLQLLALLLGVVGVGLLAVACWRWWTRPLLTVGAVGSLALAAILTVLFGKTVMRVIHLSAELRRILMGIAMSTFGFAVARLHLWIFDPIFLEFGKLDNLSGRKPNRLGVILVLGFLILLGLALLGPMIFPGERIQKREQPKVVVQIQATPTPTPKPPPQPGVEITPHAREQTDVPNQIGPSSSAAPNAPYSLSVKGDETSPSPTPSLGRELSNNVPGGIDIESAEDVPKQARAALSRALSAEGFEVRNWPKGPAKGPRDRITVKYYSSGDADRAERIRTAISRISPKLVVEVDRPAPNPPAGYRSGHIDIWLPQNAIKLLLEASKPVLKK